jgi:hypothetical protein
MVDTTNVATAATNAAAVAANAGTYVFQILVEFLVLLFGVDAIGFSCLDAICSSTLLVCVISFIIVYTIMLCQLLVQIK